jgi:Stigma-specific protein, Stig1
MKKINASIGMLLLCSVVACKSTSSDTGAAGTSGGAGTGAAGTTGAAGNLDASTDGFPIMASDGKCVANAYAHDGICACQPQTPTVCAEGCTDTMFDDLNCGACGNACPATATCNNGTCGPAATNILPAGTGCTGMQLALAGTTIYFTDKAHGKVMSVPTAGGTAAMVSATETTPSFIVANGTTAYWVNNVVGAIAADAGTPTVVGTIRKSVGGAAATDLTMETNATGGINGLTLSPDGATLYYSADTKVRKIATAGGTAADVASEVHGGIPGAVALNGTTIAYGTGINADVDVIQINPAVVAICGVEDAGGALIPASNPGCTRVARSQGGLLLNSMLLSATTAYWANDDTINANPSTAGAGQMNTEVTASTGGGISGFVGNATAIYFGVHEDNVIEKTAYPPAGSQTAITAVRLARGQSSPPSLAVDATNVYWSTTDCSISSTKL